MVVRSPMHAAKYVAIVVLLSSVLVTRAGPVVRAEVPASRAPTIMLSFPSYSGCGGEFGVPSSNEDYEQAVVEMVNRERTQRGLPPLKRVTSLDDAARYHATDMGQDNYIHHDSYDRVGSDLMQRCVLSERIETYYDPSSALAENIALGYTTTQEVMNEWMASPGDSKNITNTANWEIGVGYWSDGAPGNNRWVQDFGRRPDYYPVVINDESAETNSRYVSLYLYGAAAWLQMRLCNDGDTWSTSTWRPFDSSVEWELTNETGYRTVCVEMRSGDQTNTSCDTIFLRNEFVLGNLPASADFTYSIEEQGFFNEPGQVTPLNIGSPAPLTWTLTAAGDWFIAGPLTGTTPASSFWVTCTDFETQTATVYWGAITVTVGDPSSTENSPHRIDLSLHVVESAFPNVFLPVILRC